MSKYYKAEDVLAIFSEEERPLNWTDSVAEIQAENDFDYYKALLESLPTIEVSEDCISREYLKSFEYINKGDFNSVETIREWIDNAPSVVPKRAEGEWVVADDESILFTVYKCSRCGKIHASSPHNYCPNCGAKMKGVDDEEEDVL